MKLRIKLLIPFVLLLALSVLLIQLFWLPGFIVEETRDRQRQENEFLAILAMGLAPDILSGDLARVHASLDAVREKREQWKYLTLEDPEGRRLYPLSPWESTDGRALTVFSQAVELQDRKLGVLKAGMDFAGLVREKTDRIRGLGLVLLATLISVIGLSMIFQDAWVLKPLRRLARSVKEISDGNYDAQMPRASRDEVGDFHHAFDTMRSKLRQREADLVASRRRLAATIHNSGEGVLTIDGRGAVQSYNKSAELIFGHTREEVVGRNVSMLFPAEQQRPRESGLVQYLSEGRGDLFGNNRALRGVRKGGEVFPAWVAVGKVVLPEEIFYTAAVLDITEQKQAEETLRRGRDQLQQLVTEQTKDLLEAKEQAESASKAKSEFLTTMSHEIRTPLNAILGRTELLQETKLQEEQSAHVSALESAGEQLLQLIDDILDFSTIEAGRLELEEVVFDVRNAVDEVYSLFLHSTEQKGLEFALDYTGDELLLHRGDPTRLKQVLINIVGNAVKFTNQGRVELGMRLSGVNGATSMIFSVQDTGIGIPREKQQVIFKRFTQADSSTTRYFGGTGLGLAITRELVERMGGEVTLESEEGRGTCVQAAIPLRRVYEVGEEGLIQRREEAGGEVNAGGLPEKILVVDDALSNRRLIQYFLAKSPVKLTMAENGREAVELFKRERFDLVLMDIEMPELDGYQATERIREYEKAKGLPCTTIVALSAHVLGEFKDRCMEVGCDGFLTKPIRKNHLLKQLAKFKDSCETRETTKKDDSAG